MNRIAVLRREQRMSQGELGKIIGVAQNTISNWERGKREADNISLIIIAEYFGVSVDYLLGRSDREYEKPTSVVGDGLSEKQRMIYERIRRLTPENQEIAIGQLDVLLTHQERRDKG